MNYSGRGKIQFSGSYSFANTVINFMTVSNITFKIIS